ncbi:preprotein translocase subunit SecE [Coraliomargarita sp. SDUM461003]|uniref:Protein translocase subunit SecE n=1 Tax=Thalassobacterium maritimum TaxID=3041265 RepID=A0ABU1ATV2_9BACT|nr:preprotein translocase subunit SecE [Coraliomargarita sp. SDUM461003]MBT61753.1 preprotein translocase subunit SecE [Puniceicoccaceae bacterium]MDQ8207589.1 preprotein translocase subunit SecE [Coraliomargarita sp. SDUM461003]|tara:strand:- start:11382 stop:11585 length:204 start_codon:yes stop_codon:yes gene_type:complete
MKNPFTSIRLFYKETLTELKKASWPSKIELRDSTCVVLIATVILGSYVALIDFSLMNGVELLTSWVR